jgi:23S rRNA (cytidine1920-2'-O)/16S rRNA (cytidine1409-2'-O)-methyltransferase
MAPARRARLDRELVKRGLASSRAEAQRLIEEGRVTVGGAPVTKAATLVLPAAPVAVTRPSTRYASRGGFKLAGALDELHVTAEQRVCLDAGASTGGFTDVLLRRGAARVVAVDVGYGQLAWVLRADPRVVVLERMNVRALTPDDVPPPPPSLVVADLSFISLTLVLDALRSVATPDADFVLLVKPQFEAGRERVGKGGVVRDPEVWAAAMRRVVEKAAELGLGLVAVTPSMVPGPAGNVEFFVHLRAGELGDPFPAIHAALARAPQTAGGRPEP